MSADELHELEERAEKAREDHSLAAVSLTMAVVAVFVAVVSLLGHRAHTEEVVLQAKSSDQWAYYQAKNIRQHEDELFSDLTAVVASKDAEGMAKFREKAGQEAERYKHEKGEIKEEADKLDREVALERHRADRYDLAEVFLEVGLVVTSITLLSGKRMFWHLGIVLTVVGVVVAVMGAMVH
jgi:glutamine synthetase type III